MTRYACATKTLAIVALVVGALQFGARAAQADTILMEDFDDVSMLGAKGWVQKNNSAPADNGWFQGHASVFDSYSGAADSYIGANYLSAGFGGDISSWLITPELALEDGLTLTFFTRSAGALPDRLEVRMSTNGASTDVGSTSTSVGDFTTLLLTINPMLALSGPGTGYPTDWVQYSITLSGIGQTSGRFAFRYFVPDNENNADYIGIDNVSAVPEPATLTLLGLGLAGLAARRRQLTTRTTAREGL